MTKIWVGVWLNLLLGDFIYTNNLSPDIHIIRAATNKQSSLSINLLIITIIMF